MVFLCIHVRASSQTKSGTCHALLISLLIVRKKPTVLQSAMGLPKFKYEKKNQKDSCLSEEQVNYY